MPPGDLRCSGPNTCLTLISAILLSSCAGESGAADALQVEFDTVRGIPLAMNRGVPPVWPLDTLLSLGGRFATEEVEQFGRVRSVVADEDRNLVVLDELRDEVLVFSPVGEYLRTIGRQGPGPGEYQDPNYLGLLGDTLVVSDGTGLRADLFELDGRWIGEWRNIRNPWGIIQTGLNQIWLGTYEWDGSSEPVRVYQGRGLDGSVDTIPSLPDPSRALMEPRNVVICRSSAWLDGFSVPFGPGITRTPTPSGEILESDPVGYRMVFTSPQGDTTRIVEYQTPDIQVSDSDWEEQEEEWRRFRAERQGGTCDGHLTRPARKRLVGDVLFDDIGRIWVRRIQPKSSSKERLDVFSPEGELLGSVVTSRRFSGGRPFIRDDRIYFVTADTFDVQTVHAFRFSTPETRSRARGNS